MDITDDIGLLVMIQSLSATGNNIIEWSDAVAIGNDIALLVIM